jgi:hypothetical protein
LDWQERIHIKKDTWLSEFINSVDLSAQSERVNYVRDLGKSIISVQATSTGKLVGDGVTDDHSALQDIVDNAQGSLLLPGGRSYYLSRPVRARSNVVIDLNGARVIAPRGAIVASSGIGKLLTGKPLFTTKLGAKSFKLKSDAQIQPGEMLMFRSSALRVELGDYRHGQYASVLAVRNGTVILDVPFYATYPVSELYRLKPLVVAIQNGTIDMRSARSNSPGKTPFRGVEMRGKHCFCHNLKLLGSNEAGVGLHAEGMNVVFSECRAEGFVNLSGIIGAKGRFGYGFSLDGDSVIADNCVAINCKHGFTSGSRRITTRIMTVKNCKAASPVDGAERMTSPGGAQQPVYQAMVDAHANVLDFHVLNIETYGCNSAIAVRGGRATIERPQITSLSHTLKYRNDFLISIYEVPVSRVRVIDAVVDASAVLLEYNLFQLVITIPSRFCVRRY